MGSPNRVVPSLNASEFHQEVLLELGGVLFTQTPRKGEISGERVHFPGLNSEGHQAMAQVIKNVTHVTVAPWPWQPNWFVSRKASSPKPVTEAEHAALALLRQQHPGTQKAAEALKSLKSNV